MKDTTVHELLLNGVLMAHYTIDRGLLFLKIRRTPDPLKSISDNEDILAAAIAKIENKKIDGIAYLNIQ